MGFTGFVDDMWTAGKKIINQATGGKNNLGAMGLKGVMAPTEQGIRDSLVAQEVVRSFNKLGALDAQGNRMTAKNAQEAMSLINRVKAGNNITQEQINHIKQAADNIADITKNDAAVAAYIGREKDGLGYWNMAKGYFGDEQLGKTRRNVVIGGAAAASVGVRYLQGGNLTTTAQGERNIAGIPFI